MNDLIDKLVKTILSGGAVIDVTWLKFSGESGVVTSAIKAIGGALGGIACAMTVIYFLLELNNKMALEGTSNMTPKSILGPFLKLMIAVSLFSHSGAIITDVCSFNNYIIDKMSVITVDTSGATGVSLGVEDSYSGESFEDKELEGKNKDLYEAIMKKVDDFGMIEKVIICLVLVLAWLVSMILGLVWMYKAIMFKLELFYRLSVTPIALADVYSGMNGNAIRWIKGLIAMGIYGGAFFIIPKIAVLMSVFQFGDATALTPAGVWAMVKLIFGTLVAPFAALAAMSTIRQAAKEALQ